jgi:hypothetical protein
MSRVGRVICLMTPGLGRSSLRVMKSLIYVVAVAAALVAVVAAGALGKSSPAVNASTTLRFVEHDSAFAFVDVPPKGGERKPPSQGDQFVIGGRLTQGSKNVGTSNLVCTITQPGKNGLSTCAGTLIVAGGTITAQGVSYLTTNADTFAVTGGTGRYASATGVVVSSQSKSGAADDITVKLG